jgi:hypothetical protein
MFAEYPVNILELHSLMVSELVKIRCSIAITFPSINSAPITKANSLGLFYLGTAYDNAKLFVTFSFEK